VRTIWEGSKRNGGGMPNCMSLVVMFLIAATAMAASARWLLRKGRP